MKMISPKALVLLMFELRVNDFDGGFIHQHERWKAVRNARANVIDTLDQSNRKIWRIWKTEL